MCPSYRATRDEQHVTRGRANTLRLALSGQLGEDAFASDAMAETMKLCVSCKACKRECPTGVDMARMKIEVLAARAKRTRIFAARPAGGTSAALRALCRASRAAAQPAQSVSGSSPSFRRNFSASAPGATCRCGGATVSRRRRKRQGRTDGAEVVLWADTLQRRLRAGKSLTPPSPTLTGAGYRVHVAQPPDGGAAALLRPHLSLGRRCRRRQGGDDPHAGGPETVRHERRAGAGAGAELPVLLPR